MFRKIGHEIKQGKTLLQFGFLKGTGQAFGMIAPLIIAKFLASEALFGSYCLAKMIVFFFATLLISSAQIPFVVFANQERSKTGKINKSFSVQCMFLSISLAVFVFISLVFSRQIKSFAEVSSMDMVFMSLGFIGVALKSFFCNVFMALGQRIRNSLAELVFGVLTLILVLVLSLTGHINLRTAFLVYFISAVVVFVVFIRSLDFNLLLPFDFDFSHFKGMFDFTKWVLLGATAVYLINWVDNVILKAFKASLEDIGEYNLGYQIYKGVVMLTFMISTYFLPFVSEHIEDKVRMKDYLGRKRPRILLLGCAVIGLLYLVSPYLFKLVYVDKFQESVSVLRILLLGSVLVLYCTFYAPILNTLKMQGAAIATVLAYLCKAVIYELYFRARVRRQMGL